MRCPYSFITFFNKYFQAQVKTLNKQTKYLQTVLNNMKTQIQSLFHMKTTQLLHATCNTHVHYFVIMFMWYLWFLSYAYSSSRRYIYSVLLLLFIHTHKHQKCILRNILDRSLNMTMIPLHLNTVLIFSKCNTD